MSTPLVSLRQVTVTLQGVRALDHMDFDLYPGRHMALLGPNGSGKSTLLRLLRGEAWPDQRNGGTVTWYDPRSIDEQGNIRPDTTPLTGRSMCAIVSPSLQELYMRQGWHVSGEEVILSGLHDGYMLYGDSTPEERKAAHALARELGAAALLGQDASTLSQGQLRLLLLARSLLRHPVILLLDEATEGLDNEARAAFFRALEAVAKAENAPTIVLTSHYTDADLPEFCRIVGSMKNGKLVELCDRDISDCLPPDTPSPAFLSSGELPPQREEASCGVGFSFQHATVFLDRQEVLHDINWTVEPGQQWLLAGGNGAGKSTLLRVLMGEEPVAAGGSLRRYLAVSNAEGTARTERELSTLSEIQHHICLVSDRLQALYTHDDNALQVSLSGLDGTIGVHRECSAAEQARAMRCLRLTGMDGLAERRFRTLSTGQARRVLLARAMAGAPSLMLLDEPFSGLDASSRQGMMALIALMMRSGMQIILISHREDDILPGMTHRAIMRDGRLIRTEMLPPHNCDRTETCGPQG